MTLLKILNAIGATTLPASVIRPTSKRPVPKSKKTKPE